MSEEKETKKNYWEKYVGMLVILQLRTQPYIAISSERLEPVMNEEGIANTPVVRGLVKSVHENGEGVRMILEQGDPNGELTNKIDLDLDPDRDIGYLSIARASLITA